MRTSTILGSVAAAALGVAMLAAPAQAEFYETSDGADAKRSPADLTGLYVRHGIDDLVVRVQFEDLQRRSFGSMSVLIDTRRGRRGPEFVLVTGLGDGTDYALTRARRWRPVGEHVDCAYDARLRWGPRDSFRVKMDRGCFGDPGEVRVTVKMMDPVSPSRTVVDWAPTKRHWTPWLDTSD